MKTIFTLMAAGLFAFAVTAQDKMSATKDQKAPMEKKMTVEKIIATSKINPNKTKNIRKVAPIIREIIFQVRA